jgi:hypothetical protein
MINFNFLKKLFKREQEEIFFVDSNSDSEANSTSLMDIVIPYKGKGDSLIYVLRSIEKYFPHNRIFIVTDKKVDWAQNVTIVSCQDRHVGNKDANIIDKVMAACENGVSDEFMFWSDDQIILAPHNPIPVRNCRKPTLMVPSCRWEFRLKKTGEFVKENYKRELEFNFDSHVPQPMRKKEFLKLKGTGYQKSIGYCICTLYYGVNGFSETALQTDVKATFEYDPVFNEAKTKDKLWIGFNERMYNMGVKEYLERTFPEMSRFEKPLK